MKPGGVVAVLIPHDDPDPRQVGVVLCEKVKTFPWSTRFYRVILSDGKTDLISENYLEVIQ